MLMNQIGSIFLVLLLAGCTIQRESVAPQTTTPAPTPTVPGVPPELQIRPTSGEWTAEKGGAGGTKSFDTFKNYQYTIEVTKNNQKVDIALTSADIDVQFALFNPLGQQIGASDISRSSVNSYTVNAGTYRVAVCAARRAVGKFTLTIVGSTSDPVRIPSQILQSATQNWGPLGGGGISKTFKNHFYTFDITDDNTTVDIELSSTDTDISLFLYDNLGQQVTYASGDRYKFLLQATKKGTYTIMAGTEIRGDVGQYSLNIFGKVANLKRVESQSTTVSGQWDANSPYDINLSVPYETYSLRLTTANSPLDMELASADVNVAIKFQNEVGTLIDFTTGLRKSFPLVVEKVAQGTYRIRVHPIPVIDKGYGKYTLTVTGQFADFKKL